MLANHSLSISLGRCNLTSLQHFILGHWGMILSYSEYFNPPTPPQPSNIWCILYKLFESPEGVWFMLSLSYQLQTGHVASLIILPSRLHNFCMFFELSPKCDDNSHEQHIKTKTATCSKISASPSRLNFFYLIFSWFLYNVFDKKSWQCYTVAQFRLSWAMPTPTPVTQLAFCFPDSENKGELWGTEAGFSQSGWVSVTLWWLQGAFLDQRSRWLSLNITVFLPTNGISRLCYGAMRNKGWLYEIQRREGGRIERPH